MDESADLKDPRTWLELAILKLGHARQIFEIGLYDDAISRAYYAMYYAAKGALLTRGLDLRKHSSAIAKFRELFVITGYVEADYLHYLGQAQSARGISDYTPVVSATQQEAQDILVKAEAFIARMRDVVESPR